MASHREALSASGADGTATFILGGQIEGEDPEIFLVYPEGNYIRSSKTRPFLQIGETKFGKFWLELAALVRLDLGRRHEDRARLDAEHDESQPVGGSAVRPGDLSQRLAWCSTSTASKPTRRIWPTSNIGSSSTCSAPLDELPAIPWSTTDRRRRLGRSREGSTVVE